MLRLHCSYHKSLTLYFARVFQGLYQASACGPYKHFNSDREAFLREHGDFDVTSLNNHCLELDQFTNIRVSRFIRDPRDMVVSAYFYHLKGPEKWCNIKGPVAADFKIVNGVVPESIRGDQTFTEYLNQLPLEEGLIEEMRFREKHFESMLQWSLDDERIVLFRYEDILGKEEQVFASIFDHFGLSEQAKRVGRGLVDRFSAARRQSDRHIRNPSIGQHKKYLTGDLKRLFEERYGDVLEKYRYA